MIEIVVKNKLDKTTLESLLAALKKLKIDAELRFLPEKRTVSKDFTLAAGIWKDADISATDLRQKAWGLRK
jgi:hypothetical protein